MAADYRSIGTSELLRMWEEAVDAVRGRDLTCVPSSELDAIFGMRRELDRRKGESKPTVYVDFEGDYVTD